MYQCINVSTDQCINASMYQCVTALMCHCINISMDQWINTSIHQWINALIPQCTSVLMCHCINVSILLLCKGREDPLCHHPLNQSIQLGHISKGEIHGYVVYMVFGGPSMFLSMGQCKTTCPFHEP